MVNIGMEPDREHHQEFHDLLALGEDFARFRSRQLLIWTARWILGFAIIALLYVLNRDWVWLWWLGVGFALVLPLVALITTFLINRKIAQAGVALAELEIALSEFEAEEAERDRTA